jgi:sulfate transport system substrate-binding protein
MGIKDWNDLAKPGISVITPNPKSSGGARWNYLAAWGYAMRKFGGDEHKARTFLFDLFKNVPVLDAGARAATTTFVQRGIGDVLIAWENEAMLTLREGSGTKFQIVAPTLSILAEPPVAWVDKVTAKHGTTELARAYLQYLYSEEGQEIVVRNHYRPRLESVAAKHADEFPKIQLFTVEEMFGGWQKAHETHFKEGGVFDQIQESQR